MHKNKFILISLVSSFSLFSCGAKISVSTEDEKKGTVSYFINGNKVALQATPKDNYLFTGWFIKNVEDKDYRFERASNPYIYETKINVSIQGRFEDNSTQTFFFNKIEDKDAYTISNYYGIGTENIIIPNTHFGYPVTTIQEDTFLNNKTIKSVVIPQNIINIEDDAFTGCTNIKSLKIDHILQSCYKPFENWTAEQTIILTSNCVNEERTQTKWLWQLEKQDGYYTSTSCGGGNPHIIIE